MPRTFSTLVCFAVLAFAGADDAHAQPPFYRATPNRFAGVAPPSDCGRIPRD